MKSENKKESMKEKNKRKNVQTHRKSSGKLERKCLKGEVVIEV